jgi:hypothetical protein
MYSNLRDHSTALYQGKRQISHTFKTILQYKDYNEAVQENIDITWTECEKVGREEDDTRR